MHACIHILDPHHFGTKYALYVLYVYTEKRHLTPPINAQMHQNWPMGADSGGVKVILSSAIVSPNACDRRSHNFSSQTLFISLFYMDFIWICNTNVIMPSITLFPEKAFIQS